MTGTCHVDFDCPKCGNKTFKISAEQEAARDLNGAICTGCCYVLTENDIRAKVVEIARAEIDSVLSSTLGNALKKLG